MHIWLCLMCALIRSIFHVLIQCCVYLFFSSLWHIQRVNLSLFVRCLFCCIRSCYLSAGTFTTKNFEHNDSIWLNRAQNLFIYFYLINVTLSYCIHISSIQWNGVCVSLSDVYTIYNKWEYVICCFFYFFFIHANSKGNVVWNYSFKIFIQTLVAFEAVYSENNKNTKNNSIVYMPNINVTDKTIYFDEPNWFYAASPFILNAYCVFQYRFKWSAWYCCIFCALSLSLFSNNFWIHFMSFLFGSKFIFYFMWLRNRFSLKLELWSVGTKRM